MQWNEERDILLLREMAAGGIFQTESGSREKGSSWQNITTNLNAYNDFIVTLCAVGDRFTNIIRKHKSKARKEFARFGLGGEELNEYEQLLEVLIEKV